MATTFPKLPAWVETLIVTAIRNYVPASAIAAAIDGWKAEIFDWLTAQAASTDSPIDDVIVTKVKEALNSCTIDSDFLCGLVAKGEDFLIAKLYEVALTTPNKIDDACVKLLDDALRAT